MNISASAWSNGCESGWTGYLDESYQWQNSNKEKIGCEYSRCRNEEDMSMVSDASSGPPNLVQHDQHRQCLFGKANKKVVGENKSKKTSKQKNKAKQHQHQHQYSNCFDKYDNNLDDTASSPAFNYSKVYGYTSQEHFMGFSNNLSATHFEGNSAYNNQYGLWQSPHQENVNYSETSYSKGRRSGIRK